MTLRFKKRGDRLRRERIARRAERAVRLLEGEKPAEVQNEFNIVDALEKMKRKREQEQSDATHAGS